MVRLLFSLNGFTVGALPVYWLYPVYYNGSIPNCRFPVCQIPNC